MAVSYLGEAIAHEEVGTNDEQVTVSGVPGNAGDLLIAVVYGDGAGARPPSGWSRNRSHGMTFENRLTLFTYWRFKPTDNYEPTFTASSDTEPSGDDGREVVEIAVSAWSGTAGDSPVGAAEYVPISGGGLTAPSIRTSVDGATLVYHWFDDGTSGQRISPGDHTSRYLEEMRDSTGINESDHINTYELSTVDQASRGATGEVDAGGGGADHGIAGVLELKPVNREPYKPTISEPNGGDVVDADDPITVTWDHSDPDADDQDSYALRVKQSSASSYEYYDAANQSLTGSEVRNSGSSETVDLPAGLLSNGNDYDLGVRTWDPDGLRGPYSDTRTFTTSASPSVSLTAPSGTVTETNRPQIRWSYSDPEGDPQTRYQADVYADADVPDGASTPPDADPAWASGVVASDATETTVGEPLVNGDYVVFVRAGQSGELWSGWQSASFAIDVAPPSVPSTTALWDPDYARTALRVAARLNLVPPPYDSYEDGIGDLTPGPGVAAVSHETGETISRLGSLKIEAS